MKFIFIYIFCAAALPSFIHGDRIKEKLMDYLKSERYVLHFKEYMLHINTEAENDNWPMKFKSTYWSENLTLMLPVIVEFHQNIDGPIDQNQDIIREENQFYIGKIFKILHQYLHIVVRKNEGELKTSLIDHLREIRGTLLVWSKLLRFHVNELTHQDDNDWPMSAVGYYRERSVIVKIYKDLQSFRLNDEKEEFTELTLGIKVIGYKNTNSVKFKHSPFIAIWEDKNEKLKKKALLLYLDSINGKYYTDENGVKFKLENLQNADNDEWPMIVSGFYGSEKIPVNLKMFKDEKSCTYEDKDPRVIYRKYHEVGGSLGDLHKVDFVVVKEN